MNAKWETAQERISEVGSWLTEIIQSKNERAITGEKRTSITCGKTSKDLLSEQVESQQDWRQRNKQINIWRNTVCKFQKFWKLSIHRYKNRDQETQQLSNGMMQRRAFRKKEDTLNTE